MTDVDLGDKGNEASRVLYRITHGHTHTYTQSTYCMSMFVYSQNISEKAQKTIATVLHLIGELSSGNGWKGDSFHSVLFCTVYCCSVCMYYL